MTAVQSRTRGAAVGRADGDISTDGLGELLSRLGDDVGDLFAAELRLAVVEVREDAKQAARTSAFFVGAGVLAFVTIVLLAFAAAWGLDEVMPTGIAFLIVAVVFGGLTAALAMVGREQLRRTDLVPKQTIASIKEDIQWAKQQAS